MIWNNTQRKLEIHRIPKSAYISREEVVLKLAGVINVDVSPEDIKISRRSEANHLKIPNHKVKPRLHKARTKLKMSGYRIYFLFQPW